MTFVLVVSLSANAIAFFSLLVSLGQLNRLNAELRQLRNEMRTMAGKESDG